MYNLCDCMELQDIAKGYVVIKENDEVIIEGFNTIVNTGRSFIYSKVLAGLPFIETELPEDKKGLDYSGYKLYRAYLCENTIDSGTAPATTNESTMDNYAEFIKRAEGPNHEDTKFAQTITKKNISYDIENRDIILTFDISGNYTDDDSRVISSIILTIKSDEGSELMFSRFTFDPKVITGNALIRINYHIHF